MDTVGGLLDVVTIKNGEFQPYFLNEAENILHSSLECFFIESVISNRQMTYNYKDEI